MKRTWCCCCRSFEGHVWPLDRKKALLFFFSEQTLHSPLLHCVINSVLSRKVQKPFYIKNLHFSLSILWATPTSELGTQKSRQQTLKKARNEPPFGLRRHFEKWSGRDTGKERASTHRYVISEWKWGRRRIRRGGKGRVAFFVMCILGKRCLSPRGFLSRQQVFVIGTFVRSFLLLFVTRKGCFTIKLAHIHSETLTKVAVLWTILVLCVNWKGEMEQFP